MCVRVQACGGGGVLGWYVWVCVWEGEVSECVFVRGNICGVHIGGCESVECDCRDGDVDEVKIMF